MTDPQKETPADAGVLCTGGDEARPTTSGYLPSAGVYLDDKPGDAPKFAPIAAEFVPAPTNDNHYLNNDGPVFFLGMRGQLRISNSAGEIQFFAERLQECCHNLANQAGWWTRPDGSSITDNAYTFSNKLFAVQCNLDKAKGRFCAGIKDDNLPHRDMREVELANAVIGIFDLAGAYNMALGGAIAEKLHYNQQRADHKPENRAKAGGKAY